ncbi:MULTISPECIES: GNAT family N-acetyltransferase [unclassified Pedobacter]|uniref:GNAT family N-acetyltransferase n=1 Tax=Pedobacter TaxID=84567 RepID=UPI00209C59FF|nr:MULTISPECIES: GNAT family N-acetyltransferase [unclassified Pedobacter]MCX2582197.1 GNAT family N-acetyltransferase [Pedobacter sp. MR22-3]
MNSQLEMRILSVRHNPEYKEIAIKYLQESWPDISPIIYENCISNCLSANQFLPQWYLLEKGGEIIGCAGLITNDFISRMDLYPWICAIFIEEKHRGNAYGALLIDKAKADTKAAGFKHLNLCTDHIGYYEKYGFKYIGQGYHPWEEESRIYQLEV